TSRRHAQRCRGSSRRVRSNRRPGCDCFAAACRVPVNVSLLPLDAGFPVVAEVKPQARAANACVPPDAILCFHFQTHFSSSPHARNLAPYVVCAFFRALHIAKASAFFLRFLRLFSATHAAPAPFVSPVRGTYPLRVAN